MSYPHVARLVYRLKTDGTWSFKEPPKVERQTDAFYLRLKDDVLYVSMRQHHETVESARERVESYLRSWEISAALQYGGRPGLRFEFDKAEVLDLTEYPLPPPGTPQVVKPLCDVAAEQMRGAHRNVVANNRRLALGIGDLLDTASKLRITSPIRRIG